MEQEGFEWHKWRMGGIGSSDAPVVMGVSPYKTIEQLYLEKTGQGEEPESNFAMLRGKELEPIARARVELLEDLDFETVTLEMPDRNYMRASLDGWNEETKTLLEIKCLGKKGFSMAKAGEIPIEYIYQMAHQILVSGASEAWYYCFDGEEGVLIKKSAGQFIKECAELLKECEKFWDRVKKKEPIKVEEVKANPLKDIWNEHCGSLSKIRGLKGRRGTMAKARWKENNDSNYWVEIVEKMAASPFLTGDNDRGWKADFDFFIRPDTQDKVLEGKYDIKKNVINVDKILHLIQTTDLNSPLSEGEMNTLSQFEYDFLSDNGGRKQLSYLSREAITKLARNFNDIRD